MKITASIVIPTRARPGYLEVALASIAPQAAASGADVLVVEDDRPSPATRALAARFGAAYRSLGEPVGLNAARNAGVAHTRGELVVFVDDDVEVRPGWLAALLRAAREHPDAEVFAGPIHARLEGGWWSVRACGREDPPITALDLGPRDTDRVRYAWGANMTVRRTALERVGPFDVTLAGCGDEQEWQDRLLAEAGTDGACQPASVETGTLAETGTASGDTRSAEAGRRSPSASIPVSASIPESASAAGACHPASARRNGGSADAHPQPIVYVAAAALDHRRTPADARLRPLARAARARGRASRRYDAWRGEAPPLRHELRTLAGCAGHAVRRRCVAGVTMAAHSLGRVEQGARERREPTLPSTRASAAAATDDFLSGESGTVGGLDAARRELADRLTDARELGSGRRLRLARAARRSPPRRHVLALGVERPERHALAAAARAELERSRHDVEVHLCPPGARGKFQNLNRLLAAHPADGCDWLVVLDDDVVLPRGFLDRLVYLAERLDFQLVQPAHRARSHAAWRVTRRRAGVVARQTPFVEIGPVTAFARVTLPVLLPFPDVRMGWGLDLRWAALARAHGWGCGVLDAVAIRHSAAPAGAAYARADALAEARTLLAGGPHLSAAEAQLTLHTHRRW